MDKLYLLGVDPGLTNIGFALAEYTVKDGLHFIAVTTACMPASTCAAAKVIARETEQAIAQSKTLLDWLFGAGFIGDAPLYLCSEELSTPPSSAAVRKAGLGWGVVLGTILGRYPRAVALPAAHPKAIKHYVARNRSATKERVQLALEDHHPELQAMWPLGPRGGTGLVEHAADAAAALLYGATTTAFRSAAALL